MRFTQKFRVKEGTPMSVATVEQAHPHEFQGRVSWRLPVQVIRELSVLQPRRAVIALVFEWAGIAAGIMLSAAVRNPLVYAGAVI